MGTKRAGAKEFTSPAYTKNFFQPDECSPHRPNRLATADKKFAANANLTSRIATSRYFFISLLLKNQ
jgi:hypothetical protein